MRLLFDVRWIRPEAPDGITRYTREILTALTRRDRLDITVLYSDPTQLKGLPELNALSWCKPRDPRELFTAIKLRSKKFDIVYSPHYMFGGVGRNFKLLLTVHDLIPFSHRDKSASLFWRLFHRSYLPFRILVGQADAIVTVSETVKQQIKDIVKTSKVEVIYNAPSSRFKPAKVKIIKQLLYMGRYERYKGVETLVRAMSSLPSYKLVLLGGIEDVERNRLLAISQNNTDIIFAGRVSDSEYRRLLAQSMFFVTASLDEGFGIPLIESMAVGTPVICSDLPIFEEVCGEAATYFKRGDANGLARAVIRQEEPRTRRNLSIASLDRASRFSWDRSAAKLEVLLKSCLAADQNIE